MIVPKVLYYKLKFSIDPIKVVEAVVNYISAKEPTKESVEDFIKSEFIETFNEDFNDDIRNDIDSLIEHLSELLRDELIEEVFKSDNNIFFVNVKGGYLLTKSKKVSSTVDFKIICKILAKYLNFDFDIFTSLLSQLQTSPIRIELIHVQSTTEVKNIIYNIHNVVLVGDKEPVDEEGCMIKEKVIYDRFLIEIKNCNALELYDEAPDPYGIQIGDSLFPLVNQLFKIDGNSLLDVTKEYLTSSSNGSNKVTQKDDFQDFLNDSQNEKFLELLSKLTNNLYLNIDDIEPHEYVKYFNKLYLVSGLKNLETYHYFVNSIKNDNKLSLEGRILLGIYSDPKIETEYNLLHWISLDLENNSFKDYPGKAMPIKISDLHKVWALDQSCSYYFISDFFEDFFESLLNEEHIKFKRNIVFSYSGEKSREIDFLLYLPKKIIVIECKTRLEKHNIDDTIQKTEKFYREIPENLDKDHIEFMMFSLFYNENVRDYFSPFITEPQGAKTIDFKFKLPCGEVMHCVSSREIYKMKQILSQL